MSATKVQPAPPKRPLSGYFLFLEENRGKVKADNPNMSHKEQLSQLGKMWNALDDAMKKPYHDRSAQLNADYKIELEKYIKKYGPLKNAKQTLFTEKRAKSLSDIQKKLHPVSPLDPENHYYEKQSIGLQFKEKTESFAQYQTYQTQQGQNQKIVQQTKCEDQINCFFTYGTLQRGCRNYRHMENNLKQNKIKLLGSAFTACKYTLYLCPLTNLPYVCPIDQSYQIQGEVYKINDNSFISEMDTFEEVPGWYVRSVVPVMVQTGPQEKIRKMCWIYFNYHNPPPLFKKSQSDIYTAQKLDYGSYRDFVNQNPWAYSNKNQELNSDNIPITIKYQEYFELQDVAKQFR